MAQQRRYLFEAIANAVVARKNCDESGNTEWLEKWNTTLTELQELLPSGSGFDCGSGIAHEKCKPNRIVLYTSYHHMDEHGGYDGWTEHDVVLTPSFIGRFDIRVTGRDRNDIKNYIAETFTDVLMQDHED